MRYGQIVKTQRKQNPFQGSTKEKKLRRTRLGKVAWGPLKGLRTVEGRGRGTSMEANPKRSQMWHPEVTLSNQEPDSATSSASFPVISPVITIFASVPFPEQTLPNS